MAPVSGVTSSNMSSIYGNRNVLSGLASGMDTESMIENSVSGIQLRIVGLQKKQTTLEWKQEAYQSLTDKLVQFSRKYTSYTSSTNLLSSSFFNKAVTTTTNGANASYVSATGRSNSEIEINGVAQLATASRYQTSSSLVLDSAGGNAITAESGIDLNGLTDISNLSGNLTLTYGGKTVTLSFKETDVYETADDYANAIREKLSEQTITFSSGSSASADEVVGVTVENGNIRFFDRKASGNDVYVSGVSGNLAETFDGTDFNTENKIDTLALSGKDLKQSVSIMEYISGKSMTFNLDGTIKKITLPTTEEINAKGGTLEDAFTALLQDKFDSAFGSGKITAQNVSTDPSNPLQVRFTVNAGSSLTATSDINATLGLDDSESTYLNTGKTLSELLTSEKITELESSSAILMAEGDVTEQDDGTYRDAKGNLVNADGQRLGSDGTVLKGIELKLNDQVIGTYTRDTALESIMVGINSNTDAGVRVSYSKITNQFVMNAQDTGAGHRIEFSGGLAETIFGTYQGTGSVYTEGKDAVVNMTVNGSDLTVKRSSNTFDVDGLSVTVSDTFNGSMDASGNATFDLQTDPVTFTTTSDADKIVDAIKGMVEDYNAIMTELREAFSTIPSQKSNGSKYEPLSDTDKDSMTETAIENYEEKAKQGILFGDGDLSSLYNKFLSAITPSGNDGTTLRKMGLGTDYSKGLTTLSLDETKMREMLSTDPDTVRDAFTKVAGTGSTTNGLMQNLKTQLDAYASVQGTKGILINKAGSKYSAISLLQNSLKDQIESYDTQIEKWQDKLSYKVDYYTRQFTRLEQLISQSNSQSASIMGLMGMG